MESRIRELCFKLMNTRNPDRMEQIGDELRDAIHESIERLRGQIVVLSFEPREPVTAVETSEAA